jgi:hypothetical protein
MRLLSFIFLATILLSCGNNSIYCDVAQQTINTCTGMSISKLRLECSDGEESYYFEKMPNKLGTSIFSLIIIDTCYTAKIDGSNAGIRGFSLKPNEKYLVENCSIGDAATGTLYFETADKGVIVETNKASCK